jgi:F0F1-type ATP synthase assembly protein I
MAERTRRDQDAARDEVDSLTGGPGVVATKSQAQGALVGILVGAIVGAILGGLVGLLADFLIVGLIVGAVAGAVVTGVAGGGQRPKQKLGSTEADG